MKTLTVEGILALGLACARSFGESVTRDACEAIASQIALEESARAPIAEHLNHLAIAANLAGSEPSTLSALQRVHFLKSAVSHVAWAESRVNTAVLAIAGVQRRIQTAQVGIADARPQRVEIEDAARSEIALAARWSELQAQTRLETARLLHALLPKTADALALGSISQLHATVIADGAARLAAGFGVDATHPDATHNTAAWCSLTAVVSELDGRASVIAAHSTRTATRSAVMRIVDRLDPKGMHRRREHAARDRGVWVQPEGDGNSLLFARMSSMQAEACLSRIRERAAANRSDSVAAGNRDPRGIGELRAEAYAEIVLGTRGDVQPLESPRLRADIDVVITLDALLGFHRVDGDTAMLRAHGCEDAVVPGAEIRDLLSVPWVEASLRRLVTDPVTGHLLDVSAHRYKPSDRLRAFISTRDRRCRWPGCGRRSEHSDLDHATPFHLGGQSTVANLGALCRRHHLLKTHAGYAIPESNTDGTCTIATPAGERYAHAAVSILAMDDPPPF